jgi:general secretion pathway protein D
LFIHARGQDIVCILVKLRGLAVLILAPALAWAASQAEQLFEQGQKAERAGDPARAYVYYTQAAVADPGNLKYWSRAEALRPMAGILDVPQAKHGDDLLPEKMDPAVFGHIGDRELEEARRPLPPAELKATPGKSDYDLRGDSKSLWEQVAATLHLGIIFDTQYQPTAALHFQLNDADYKETLRALEAATNSFLSPVSDQLIFVANDTTQKRTEFERTAAVVIPFPETETVQELQEIATSVRGVLDIQRLMIDNQRRLILVRDRVAKVRLAEKVLHDLLRSRAQVAVDVEIITTDLSSSLSYGISPQTAFPLLNFPNKSNLLNSIPAAYNAFLTFGGGASVIGLGVTSAQLFATASKSSSETVLHSQLLALDGQAASMHIGDKYPIITNSYLGSGATSPTTGYPTTGTGPGGIPTTPVTPGVLTTGSLEISQTAVTWTYSSGGAVPTETNITVNSTAGAIGYTATVASSSQWVLVNNQAAAVTGSLPTTLTISPGPKLAALGTGTYLAGIQVTASDGSVNYITVNLTVNGGAQNFTLSPSSVTLTSSPGGLQVQQPVTVTGSNNSISTLSATVAGTGLSLSLSANSVSLDAPATVTVLGNPAGIAAQTYAGVLSVTVDGNTQEIPVTFAVVSSSSLILSQSSAAWNYTTGGTLPTAATITVTSASAISFTATASSANGWLLVNGQTQFTSNLPATLIIAPTSNLTQLSTGTYTGTVQLTAQDGSFVYFTVSLVVNGGTATGITVSPNPITVNAALYGTPVQQAITVTSENSGAFTATVSGSGLSLLDSNNAIVNSINTTIQANTPITLTLNADPTNLAGQNYIGYLTITAAGVTQTVEITFSVGAINSGTNGTGIYAPPPTFNFEDLGLVLKITPHLHGADDVTLDVSTEFKLLGAASVNGIPVISSKKYESKVRLVEGEWAVLAGLMTASDARTITGIPGMSLLPFLRNNTVNKDTGQTLIVLKPHITILPPSEYPTTRAFTGTETKLPTDL